MKLAPKLLAPPVGLAVALACVIAFAFWQNAKVAAMRQEASKTSAQIIEASEVRALSRAVQRDALNMIFDPSDADRPGFDKKTAERGDELKARAAKLTASFGREDATLMGEFMKLQERVLTEIDAVKKLAAQRKIEEAYGLFRSGVRPAERVASKLTDGYIDSKTQELARLDGTIRESSTAADRLVVLSSVSLLLAALAGAVLATHLLVVRPSQRLAGRVERMAKGDFADDGKDARRHDELGRIARALDSFAEELGAAARLREEQSHSASARQAEQEQSEAGRIVAQRKQAFVVERLAKGLEQLAAGRLTYRLNDAFAPEYERLRSDFNATMAQLQETLTTIKANADLIGSGAGDIGQAADDLSRRTEQQAASLEETAAALDEITATVRKTAEGATQAADVVAAARIDAERSGAVVEEATGAMSEIERSARQISQIIGVVDDIAFQTNLLALNAGVEAARAGEAGRGFAIVAVEVRNLAQRSAAAAKEIKDLIVASSQHVEKGVALVHRTGKDLDAISGKVARTAELVTEIAAAAKEQATGLDQVNTAVNQMDQVTQQNAAMVVETTNATHDLGSETAELTRLIDMFEVADDAANQGRPAFGRRARAA